MGQDRELTEEQKRFVLETIERYIEIWEKEEKVALEADRDRRLDALE
jgi:septum formation topological specificity factor MinE